MTRLRLRTPSRLHFGLLGWGPEAPRQFGGVGLMIDAPGIELTAQPADHWHARGPLAERALRVAERVANCFEHQGISVDCLHFNIKCAAPEHVGLGTGTQLGLAVARLITMSTGQADVPVVQLAGLAGRGLRSGIGLHGFAVGGLIVDGGRGSESAVPPLLARFAFPAEWSVLVVVPEGLTGLHGPDEQRAFATLPAIPASATDRLCGLILLRLLPSIVEGDLPQFGVALAEIQRLVGQSFAPAQGGLYARPELEPVVTHLRAEGLHGVGQSSWGPTLYGFSQESEDARWRILERLRTRFGLRPESAFWTRANNEGARVVLEPSDAGSERDGPANRG
jgi:beta-ribofuranosylaminobenzene 5'-phosphate synthase